MRALLPAWLELMWTLIASVSSGGQWSSCVQRHCFAPVFPKFWLLECSCSLFCYFLTLEWDGCNIDDPLMAEHSPNTCSPHLDQSLTSDFVSGTHELPTSSCSIRLFHYLGLLDLAYIYWNMVSAGLYSGDFRKPLEEHRKKVIDPLFLGNAEHFKHLIFF